MTHRLLVDYYTANERHIYCFLVPSFVILVSVLDVFFFITGFPLTKLRLHKRSNNLPDPSGISRREVLVTNTLPNSLSNNQTTEQEPTSLKMTFVIEEKNAFRRWSCCYHISNDMISMSNE